MTKFLLLFFFAYSCLASEVLCVICPNNSFNIKQFACDEKCDAEADSFCAFCEERLSVGQCICKIELQEPIYFHKKCLNADSSLCSSCFINIENKLMWKEKFKKIKSSCCSFLNNSGKCLAWSFLGIGSIFIVYYFSMGPGNDHYCPCLFNMSFSQESSCDFSKYPGCDRRIQ